MSHALFERALKSMPLGVGSSFQVGDPYPIYLREGRGANVWDVDGHEYVDTHGGFGSMVVGHAHPKIVEAINRADRARLALRGAHRRRACCSRRSSAAASTSSRCASRTPGTEATMSAIRVARAATGRDDIVKIEGSYHGHHDAVMFSVVPNADLMGGREAPASEPMSLGVPQYLRGHTHAVPFNDLTVLVEAARRASATRSRASSSSR